jgi:hypothetical protein
MPLESQHTIFLFVFPLFIRFPPFYSFFPFLFVFPLFIRFPCRYGEDHEPKEPRDLVDDGDAWGDDDVLNGMLGANVEEHGSQIDMQSVD